MEQIYLFFNHPFFVIIGGLATLISVITTIVMLFLITKGIFPVWYRLGMGLSRRKIAIFAEDEYDDLYNMLVDSKIFQKKNITKITKSSIKKVGEFTLLLVHYDPNKNYLDDVLSNKKDNAALIIYAPHSEGQIDLAVMQRINIERNSIVVNMRGRLLNDILSSMITTSYD